MGGKTLIGGKAALMRILITNDDGIQRARPCSCWFASQTILPDDVWVCAPETDQSGLAHSLTLSEPLRLRKVDDKRFALKGTPTDCVIMGVRELMPAPPDLILSGVNSGQNIADDVTYSGTVAGAMEGTHARHSLDRASARPILGMKRHRNVPWQTGEAHAPEIISETA